MRPVVARGEVAVPREELYARLADLRSHWRIAGHWIAPLELGDDGGVVELRGPLGMTRTVRTSLDDRDPPCRLAGSAVVGATHAEISWTLEERGASTVVTLRADLLRVAPWDRVVLLVFARRWLARRFAATLSRLA